MPGCLELKFKLLKLRRYALYSWPPTFDGRQLVQQLYGPPITNKENQRQRNRNINKTSKSANWRELNANQVCSKQESPNVLCRSLNKSINQFSFKGSSIYDVHKKIGFLIPLPTVHLRPHEPDPPPPCGHPHAIDLKYTSLSRNSYYNDLPDLKLKCDCNLFIIVTFWNYTIIYIANLYWRKMSTFIPYKDKILVPKNSNFFAWEEDRITSVGCNFLCGRPHGADPSPLSTCVHLSLTPSPFVWTS